MELRNDDPYSLGTITLFDDGEIALDPPRVVLRRSPLDAYFTTIEDDNFPDISFQAYNSSRFWWLIYLANEVFFPFDLEADYGTNIVVPDMETFKMNNP